MLRSDLRRCITVALSSNMGFGFDGCSVVTLQSWWFLQTQEHKKSAISKTFLLLQDGKVYTLFLQQVGLVLFLFLLWWLICEDSSSVGLLLGPCVCLYVHVYVWGTVLLSGWNKASECFVVCRINHSPREHGKNISGYQLTTVMYLPAIILQRAHSHCHIYAPPLLSSQTHTHRFNYRWPSWRW